MRRIIKKAAGPPEYKGRNEGVSGVNGQAAAKERWGSTAAYKEYEQKTAGKSEEELQAAGEGLTALLAGFGARREKPASAPETQAQVKALQAYITAHFYTCTDEILAGLGRLYAAGGEYAETIDGLGGIGTAAFAAEAIACYCAHKEP